MPELRKLSVVQPAATTQTPVQRAPEAHVHHRGNNIKENQKHFGIDSTPRKTLSV